MKIVLSRLKLLGFETMMHDWQFSNKNSRDHLPLNHRGTGSSSEHYFMTTRFIKLTEFPLTKHVGFNSLHRSVTIVYTLKIEEPYDLGF